MFFSVYYTTMVVGEMVSQYLSCIFLAVTMQIWAKEYYEAIPKDTKCEILDPALVHNFTCTSKYINRTMSLRSQEITFQPGVVLNNYHLKIQLMRKFGKTFRPFLINIEQDFCAFTNENGVDSSSSLMKKMLNLQSRYRFGNWYHSCPISGRRYEKDVPMDNSKMPDVAMAGEHRFDLTAFTVINGIRRELSLTQHFGEIRSKSKKGM